MARSRPFQRPTERQVDVHRTAPYSVEAEQGVLGSMMIDPRRTIPEVIRLITEEHFYVPAHQTIYNALVERWRARAGIDLITFTEVLRARKLLDSVGGAAFVTSLFTFVPTSANVLYYLDIVIDKYQRREIVEACTEAVRRAYEEQDQSIEPIKKRLWDGLRKTESRVNESLTTATVREVRDMVYARQIGGELGLPTGIPSWDKELHGIFPKRFYVIGARPKIGKTSLIEQAAQHQNRNGVPVLIFERDMSLADLIGRMACRDAGVAFESFQIGKLKDDQLRRLEIALEKIDPSLLRVYSPANLTSAELVSIIEREIEENKIQVFYLDLFQRIKTNERDRVEGLTAAANAIRDVIQSTGVPGVILAEILKEADKTKRPHSGQFKYCDGLFSSCDTSIMLWTEDDPKNLVDDEGVMRRQQITFTIDANRGGPVCDSTMWFDRPLMKFYATDQGE
jgi:replicative DNA helicase